MSADSQQYINEMRKLTNQASIDFAKNGLSGCFLLNGAASTAILASKAEVFYVAAIIFAIGAFWAILATFCSYAYCLLLLRSWDSPSIPFSEKRIPVYIFGWHFVSHEEIEKLRYIPIGLVAASCLCFILGILIIIFKIV